MVDLVSRLDERVREIHGGKDVHSFAELKRVLATINGTATEGLRELAYEPYFSILTQIQTFVASIELEFIEGSESNFLAHCKFPGYRFKFVVPRLKTAHDYIRRVRDGVDNKLAKFQDFFGDVSERVKISIMPSEDGQIETCDVSDRKICWPIGRFIVPVKNGYEVLDFEYKLGPQGRVMASTKRITEGPITYLAALTFPDFHGTLVKAGHTEPYPLEETLKPVLLSKYGELISKPLTRPDPNT